MLKRLILTIIPVLLVFFFVGSVHAELFENNTLGGRVLGMGGAFTGLSDDNYALFYNPAGLAGLRGMNITLNYQPVLAVDDVSSIGIIGSYSIKNLGFGGAFYQIAQDGGVSLIAINLAGAYHLGNLRLGPLHNIRVGIALNMYHISMDGYIPSGGEGYKDSASSFTFSVGGLFNLFVKEFSFGFFVKNITQPNISLFEDGEGSDIKREARIGLSYLLNEYFRVNIDYAFRNYDYSTDKLDNIFVGAEIYFYKAVSMRFGFDEGLLCIGLGVNTARLCFDGAIRVSGDVETYYQFDVTIKL